MFLGYIVHERDDLKLEITTSIEHIKINAVNLLETPSGVAEINLSVNLLDAKLLRYLATCLGFDSVTIVTALQAFRS
jgi:hypothetical protein